MLDAYASGEPVWLEAAGPDGAQAGDGARAALTGAFVPLPGDQRPLGVLAVEFETPHVFAPDELDLTITDDGAGPAPVPDGHTGQGLRNMRERARRLGGRLTVRPNQGGGTVVALALPLDSDLPEPEPAELALRMGVPT